MQNSLTYVQMLELEDEAEFKKLLMQRLRLAPEERERLLEEMIDHETRTKSAEKTMSGKEITPQVRLVLNVFNRERSSEVADFLAKFKTVLGNGGPDFVQDAMLAKAASDRVHLGMHREFAAFISD